MRVHPVTFGVLAGLGALIIGACGTSAPAGFTSPEGGAGPLTSGSGDGGSMSSTLSDGAVTTPHPAVVGTLKGKVVAPEGTIPISGALIYLAKAAPDPIPGSVFCDTCVHLTPDEPYAYSASDGTFELGAYATGMQMLVVQKGEFRRVRPFNVVAGDQAVPAELSRFPGKTDSTMGDTIPMIAMTVGGFDGIDVTMAKLGIQEFYRYGDAPPPFPQPTVGTVTGKTANAIMMDPAELQKYHIVLLPCASLGDTQDENDDGFVCGAPTGPMSPAFKSFVEAGGKFYVTDFAYEAVRQTWPGLVTFYDADDNPLTNTSDGIGTACRAGSDTNPGTAQDPGLASWMSAIGDSSFDLEESWTRIASVQSQPGIDPMGKPVTVTPKVWMTENIAPGEDLPATVSFEDKCGRVMFSTYHCEGDATSSLIAQEKALLYILLEVQVCVGQLPPPQAQ